MNLTRILHEGVDLCRGILGSRPRRLTAPPEDLTIGVSAFQEAGEISFSNAFEEAFEAGAPAETGYAWPEAPLYHLRNLFLTGEQGHLFTSRGEYLSLCGVCGRIPPQKIRRPVAGLARRIEEPVVHLCGPNNENHGHFVLDYLPKILAVREILASDPALRVLVPAGHRKWKSSYLSRLGIAGDRVIEQESGTTFAREVWYVPIPTADGHLCDPKIQLELRDALEEGIEPHEEARPLFVTRMEDAPNKRATNEGELIELTRKVYPDVLPMVLSKCSFEEQVARFKAAPVVIGSIGQGLTDVLFCRKARLLVICHGSQEKLKKARAWSRAYCHLARIGGNEAFQLKTSTPRDANRDYVVDAAGYGRALEYLAERVEKS